MGTYVISKDELRRHFEPFLKDMEGEVNAVNLADVWNELANENGWMDRLQAKVMY